MLSIPPLFPALVMDTQGSELLVLRGADPRLPSFAFIKTEVADFEAYSGCCQLAEVTAFLSARGFRGVLTAGVRRALQRRSLLRRR